MSDFMITVIQQGLIYGILALGVYITYKILDFPDLTADGSFPLGGAITAFMLTRGMNVYLTLFISFFSGVIAGACTGLIHVKLKVKDLLSGIIMMTALYTINLKIAGTNNVPLFSVETIFNNEFYNSLDINNILKKTLMILIIVIICKKMLDFYLSTKQGFLLKAVGDNPKVVTMLAKDKGNIKIAGLALANGLIALSGSVFAQEQKVFDISMGTGTIVIGLASVIIGVSLFKKVSFLKETTAVIIGAVIYKICVAIAIRFFDPQSMKLIMAMLFLLILVLGMERKQKIHKEVKKC